MNHHPSFGWGREWARAEGCRRNPIIGPRGKSILLNIVMLVSYYKMIEYNVVKYITDLPIVGIGV